MSPSSSPSEPEPFGFLVAAGPVAAATTASAWLQAMLDAEAALALAQADVGLVPAAAAERIADACRVERFDVGALLDEAALGGNAVIALVPALRALVGPATTPPTSIAAPPARTSSTPPPPSSSPAAPTSCGRGSARLGRRAVELGDRYGDTPMIARTLGQHAVPTTFATVTVTVGRCASARRLPG